MDLRHPTRQSLDSEATAFAGNDVYACRTLAVGLDGITLLAQHPRKGGEFVRLQCCFEPGHWLDADGVIEESFIRDGEWCWSIAFVGLNEHQKEELRAILRSKAAPPRRASPSTPVNAAPTQPPSSPFTPPTLPPSSPFHSRPTQPPSSPFNGSPPRPPSAAFHEPPTGAHHEVAMRPPPAAYHEVPTRPSSSSAPQRPPSDAAPPRPPSAPFQPVPPRSPKDPVAAPSGMRPRARASSPPPISLAELYRDALAEVKEVEKAHRNVVGSDDAVWQARNWTRRSG